MFHLITTALIFILIGCGSSLTTTPTTAAVKPQAFSNDSVAAPGASNTQVPVATSVPTTTPAAQPNTFVQGTMDVGQQVTSLSTGSMIKYEHILADRNKEYNTATGIFTPKKPGFYFVQAQLGFQSPATTGWAAANYCQMWILKSDGSFPANRFMSMKAGDTIPCVVGVSAIVGLMQGQSFSFGAIAVPTSTSISYSNNPYSSVNIVWVGD